VSRALWAILIAGCWRDPVAPPVAANHPEPPPARASDPRCLKLPDRVVERAGSGVDEAYVRASAELLARRCSFDRWTADAVACYWTSERNCDRLLTPWQRHMIECVSDNAPYEQWTADPALLPSVERSCRDEWTRERR